MRQSLARARTGTMVSIVLALVAAISTAHLDNAGAEGFRDIEVEIRRDPGERPILSLDGHSIFDPGDQYMVAVHLRRIPCHGIFHFDSWGEDRGAGTQTEFHTTMRLDSLHTRPARLPCGAALPPRAGRAATKVVLSNEESTPVVLEAGPRRPGRELEATLTVNGLTSCERPYDLLVILVNPHGVREYRYRATFLAAESTLNGHPQPVPHCPEPDSR